MQIMCWSCTEPYDGSLARCPQCGASKNPPVRKPIPEVAEKKPEFKKFPVKKLPGRK